MVTGRQSFLAVTNTIATVNDRWPAVVLSRVCRVRRLWKYHIIKRWLQPCFLKCSIRPLLIFLGNKEKHVLNVMFYWWCFILACPICCVPLILFFLLCILIFIDFFVLFYYLLSHGFLSFSFFFSFIFCILIFLFFSLILICGFSL